MVVNVLYEFVRDLQFLGAVEKLIFAHRGDACDFLIHETDVTNCLDDVAGSRFALGADHGGAFFDTAEGFAEVTGSADERHFEFAFVDMENVVGGGEYFAFVDIVNFDGFEELCFDKVTDTALGHHGDGNGVLDALDHLGVAHARDSACGADVGRDTFKCHDCGGTGCFCNFCLFRGGHIHDDSTFKHLGEIFVEFVAVFCRHWVLLVAFVSFRGLN